MDAYYELLAALPGWLAGPLQGVPPYVAARVQELRLREGCAPAVAYGGQLCAAARLPGAAAALQNLFVAPQQLQQLLYELCGQSVHSHQAELAQGFVTLPGGHRVGFGGQYLQHPTEGRLLQRVSSVNIRIARSCDVRLPAEFCALLREHTASGILLVGEPGSGKTTVLRQTARYLAGLRYAVAVLDERGELFPPGVVKPAFEGDVVAGLPKAEAMQLALRTLAPQVMLLDELGSLQETRQLEQSCFCGVGFVATIHAQTVQQARQRPQLRFLERRHMLCAAVPLAGRSMPGQLGKPVLL